MSFDDNALPLISIESELKEDINGSIRNEKLDSLADQLNVVQRRLDGGVPPKEYDSLSMFKEAIDVSSKIIRDVWEKHH